MKYLVTTLKSNKIIWSILVFFLVGYVSGQSKEQLEAERLLIIKQIEATSEVLNRTKQNKDLALQEYHALQDQIESRNALLNNIEDFIDKMNLNVSENKVLIDSLKRNLFYLNNNFANLANLHLKRKLLQKPWMLLLSANSLKEGFVKWRALKQYEKHFQNQTEFINALNNNIAEKIFDIEEELEKKKLVLELEQDQNKILELEKIRKNKTLSNLDQSEKTLQLSLDKQRRNRENLNIAIEENILRELSLFDKNKVVKTVPKEVANTKSTPIGLDFRQHKGQLDLPANGRIVGFYGKHQHPEIEHLQIQNNGINIQTSKGEIARCIYDGNVVSISFVPGHQNLIIVQHGEYFSVYSNIDEAKVVKGQMVTQNDPIGVIHTDKNFKTELHLEIWNGKIKENPSLWIKR